MSAGSTHVTYGDVALQDCLLRDFSQMPVFAEDGKTFLYNKFTISVQGWFVSRDTGSLSSTVQIDSVNTPSPYPNAGDRYLWLERMLTVPRQQFRMHIGYGGPSPTLLVQSNPPSYPNTNIFDSVNDVIDVYADRNGGPYVRDIAIQEIVANETLKVKATFEVAVRPDCLENGTGQQMAYGVLSNRWNCVDHIDEHRFTTRTYSGEIRLSTPAISPNEFRFLALPPLLTGMMRKSIEFAAQTDGLKLRYTIRDEEVTVTPIGMGDLGNDGTYMRVSRQDNIGMFTKNIVTNLSISLDGTPHSRRSDLIRQVQVYADAKLALGDTVKPVIKANDRTAIIRSYQMGEEYDSGKLNKVSLNVVVERVPDAGKPEGELGMIRQQIKTFGNQVQGSDLAAATSDPTLQTYLGNYNSFRSWGNRIWSGTALNDEIPFVEGSIQVAAALTVHLQTFCTQDFSMCSGLTASTARMAAIRDSRATCPQLDDVGFVHWHELPTMDNEFVSTSHKTNMYQHTRLESQYDKEEMTYALPVARPVDPYLSPGDGSIPQSTLTINDNNYQTAHVQIAPPQNLRVIRIEAERTGAPPELPPPKNNFKDADGITHALINDRVIIGAPEMNANQDSRKYRVRSEYVYSMSHSPKSFKPGVPPDDGANDRTDLMKEFTIRYADLFNGVPIDYPDGA